MVLPALHREHLPSAGEIVLFDRSWYKRKYWFSVSDVEQQKRFRSRAKDPMRRWKLSPMDLESITRWEDYSEAKERMMQATDKPWAPWSVVESDDKRAARINVMHHLLTSVPHEAIEPSLPSIPERPPARGYVRPPMESQTYVPDHAAQLQARHRAERGAGGKP